MASQISSAATTGTLELEPAPTPTAPVTTAPSVFTRESVRKATSGSLLGLRTSLPLVVSDIFAVLVSCYVAKLMSLVFFGNPDVPGYRAVVGLLVAVPAVFAVLGLYPGLMLHPSEELKKVASGAAVAFIGLIISSFVIRNHIFAHIVNRVFHLGTLALTLAIFRYVTRAWFSRKTWWRHPVEIHANLEETEAIERWLKKRFYAGVRPRLPEDPEPRHAIVAEGSMHNAAGEMDDVNALIWKHPTVSVIAFAGDEPYVTRTVHNFLLMPWQRILKRVMDVTLVLLSLPVLLPVLAALAVIVRMNSRGPIFYCSSRWGLNGREFKAWKFRSMVTDADRVLKQHLDSNPELREEWNRDLKLKNDPRITSVGRFLRSSSLDELPQLWNVFIGDMSLVGPRPILGDEISRYGDVYDLYKSVVPGITGLWQISGRNNTTYEERLAYVSYYVRQWSPWMDIYILIRTVVTVLSREGAC